MIEETGQVVAVEDGAVWVETVRQSTCRSCAASKGCGHAVLDRSRVGARARVRALSEGHVLQVGQSVVLGLPEGALMRAAVLVYLLPLVLMFAGALIGDGMAADGAGAAIGGILGLASGFLVNRWYSLGHSRDPALHPRVVRTLAP